MRHTTILPPLLFAALAATTLSQLTTTKPPSYLNQIYANVPWDDTPDILKQCPNNTFGNGGAGVTIFLVDSGCDALHPEFNETAPGQLVNYVIEPTDPAGWQDERVGIDSRGGSTHMASLLVGKKYGIAKQTKIVCIRVYDVVKNSDPLPPPGSISNSTSNTTNPDATPSPSPTPLDPGALDMIATFAGASQEKDIARGIEMARELAKDEIAAGNTPILVLTSQATLHFEKLPWGCVKEGTTAIDFSKFTQLCIRPAPKAYIPEYPSCEWVRDEQVPLDQCHSFLDWQLKGAFEDGLRVIVSAGNENGDSCSKSIARIPARGYGITIGAVNNGGSLWEPLAELPNVATNTGPCVNAYAPGMDVPGAWPFDERVKDGKVIPGGEYMRNSARTSTSTILTAGVAALILTEEPFLNLTQLIAAFDKLAVKRVTENGNNRPILSIPCNQTILPPFTPPPTPSPTPAPTPAPTAGPGFSISGPGGISDQFSFSISGPGGISDVVSTPCVEPFGPLSILKVGVFSITGAEIKHSQINGRTIIADELVALCSQFRYELTDDIVTEYVLQVGDAMELKGTVILNSSALCGGTLTIDQISKAVPTGTIKQGSNSLDVDGLAETMAFFIIEYGKLATTGTYDAATKTMTGDDDVVNVFSFDSAEIFAGILAVDVPEGSTIVVNIKGTSPSLVNYNMPKGLYGPFTVINFPDMRVLDVLTIKKSWMVATIITNGIMKMEDSYLRGQIIVGEILMKSTFVDVEVFEGDPFPCDVAIGGGGGPVPGGGGGGDGERCICPHRKHKGSGKDSGKDASPCSSADSSDDSSHDVDRMEEGVVVRHSKGKGDKSGVDRKAKKVRYGVTKGGQCICKRSKKSKKAKKEKKDDTSKDKSKKGKKSKDDTSKDKGGKKDKKGKKSTDKKSSKDKSKGKGKK
mmetsp:Transcript_12301/g.31039  ORF Transcript_12301/g.31039 Transcript_12301/m.31039 type:complete len:920 (-) Transcript_12301:128-2887(-)